MKLETFFEKFDQFADAPNAVARMREIVLEFAIRGKLVPQVSSEEPASVLLERNDTKFVKRSEKERIQVQLPVSNEEMYLQLPQKWKWTRLGYTGRVFNGESVSESGKAELAKVVSGLPFIATKDVGYGREMLTYENGLIVPFGDPRFKVAHENAVLICAEGGSAGRKIGITNRDICFGNKLFAIETVVGVHHRYIFYLYQAPSFFMQFTKRMTGIIGGIARSEFISLPIPIPPEREQKRIVAKVDVLMALCDQLEAQQKERETRHISLARASLARFSESPTPTNLNFQFHKSYDISPADLRKTILSLAVQGKLVPQDPSDEPGDQILARIHASGLNRKLDRRNQVIAPKDEFPFELPIGWTASRLGLVLHPNREISYGVIKLGAEPKQGGVFILRCSNVRFRRIELNGIRRVTEQISSAYRRTVLEGGEVLINVRGTLGGCSVVQPELKGYNIAREIAVVPVHSEIVPSFLLNVIASPYFQHKVKENLRGIAYEGLNLSLLRKFIVPIPPYLEQRRIVAKVDQLMALVDQLETQLATSRTTAKNLLDAVVSELTNPTADSSKK